MLVQPKPIHPMKRMRLVARVDRHGFLTAPSQPPPLPPPQIQPIYLPTASPITPLQPVSFMYSGTEAAKPIPYTLPQFLSIWNVNAHQQVQGEINSWNYCAPKTIPVPNCDYIPRAFKPVYRSKEEEPKRTEISLNETFLETDLSSSEYEKDRRPSSRKSVNTCSRKKSKCKEEGREPTFKERMKMLPELKHLKVLNSLIKERLRNAGKVSRVSECRLCGSFSCGTTNTRTMTTFMRSHLYTHVSTVFTCGICKSYKANTMSRMRHHVRKLHGVGHVDKASSVIDGRYDIDDQLVNLAKRCFSNSVITPKTS